jgi:hypothetical protein
MEDLEKKLVIEFINGGALVTAELESNLIASVKYDSLVCNFISQAAVIQKKLISVAGVSKRNIDFYAKMGTAVADSLFRSLHAFYGLLRDNQEFSSLPLPILSPIAMDLVYEDIENKNKVDECFSYLSHIWYNRENSVRAICSVVDRSRKHFYSYFPVAVSKQVDTIQFGFNALSIESLSATTLLYRFLEKSAYIGNP